MEPINWQPPWQGRLSFDYYCCNFVPANSVRGKDTDGPLEEASHIPNSRIDTTRAEDTLNIQKLEAPAFHGSDPEAQRRRPQGVPPELRSFLGELIFILLCFMGLFLFGLFLGNVVINQAIFPDRLGVSASNTPWLIG